MGHEAECSVEACQENDANTNIRIYLYLIFSLVMECVKRQIKRTQMVELV